MRSSFLRNIVLSTVCLPLTLLLGTSVPQTQGPDKSAGDQKDKIHGRAMQTMSDEHIPTLLSKTTGDVHVECRPAVYERIELDPPSEIATLARGSDLVVTGRITTAGNPHLTEDETFVYSDWRFEITEVLLNVSPQTLASGSTVSILRPGGDLKVNGSRTVHAHCSEFLSDFKTGSEYLLFLKLVPETGAYTLRSPDGFAFSEGKPIGLGRWLRMDKWSVYDKGSLLEMTRNAARPLDAGATKLHQ